MDALGYITIIILPPKISIHHITITTAFTRVNFLTAMETTFMKTLEYTIKPGIVSEEALSFIVVCIMATVCRFPFNFPAGIQHWKWFTDSHL